MKFYGAVMIADNPPHPDSASEWVEITPAQHSKIVDILINNKKIGAETRMK